MKVATLVASKVKGSVEARVDITALVASSVVQAVKDAETEESKELQSKGIDTMEPDKQAYYIGLALREVQNLIEMANFNLGGPLKQGKPVVTNMFFNRDGSSEVEVNVPFEMEAREDYSEVSGAFNLEIRKEYKDLVTYTVVLPTVTKPSAAVSLTIRVPAALIASIGADKYDTRTKVLQKYIEGSIKKELA